MKLSSAARRTFRKQIKTYVKARHDQVYLKCHTAITSHLLMHHAYVRFFFQLFKSMIRNIFYENRNTLKNKREREFLFFFWVKRESFSLVSLPTLAAKPQFSDISTVNSRKPTAPFFRWFLAPPVSSCPSHTHRSYLTALLPSCPCDSGSLIHHT